MHNQSSVTPPPTAELTTQTLIDGVGQLLTNYIEKSKKGEDKVLQQQPPRNIAEDLKAREILHSGFQDSQEALQFVKRYLTHTNHLKNPHYLGHQVAVPHDLSGIPDWIHGTINNPSSLYEMGPAGATLEGVVINWMLQKVGWFSGDDIYDFRLKAGAGSGFLTHGGSVANLTALAAARAAIAPKAWDEGNPQNLVVIGPESSHYSIGRAISILGLGKNAYRPVPVHEDETLDTTALAAVYEKACADGKQVMAVVANACATSTGLFDKLSTVGDFCEKHQLWFHVDAAHGGAALLSRQHAHLLQGIEKANSIIWDAHKMMLVPALCTAVLFKDARYQTDNFQQKGSYVFHEQEVVGMDTMPFTVECTKSALGTKLFWSFALLGEKGLEDFIDTTFNRTKEFYQLLEAHPNFSVPYSPQSNILCFQYLPFAQDNEKQMALRYALIERGNFYITSCEVRGQRCLRTVLMNPNTSLADCRDLLHEIEATAAFL